MNGDAANHAVNGTKDDEWDSWNPMAEHYFEGLRNGFNRGPAAKLPSEQLQSRPTVSSHVSTASSASSSTPSPSEIDYATLVIRQVPEGLSEV